ncbi:MAG: isocitrate lyase/phosphoenolpyruvate mutase family protein [Pseudomonadota bacterium]
MLSQAEKANIFQTLHHEGTFVMANFWDTGSAVILENLGFKALASTSAGYAQSIGKLDSQITLEEKLRHLSEVCARTSAPINADFEHGFADTAEGAAENLLRAAEAGVVGLSIEDWSRNEIYDKEEATDRIQACVEAKNKFDFPFTLTARSEVILRRTGDLDEAISRLLAYEAAGADVLYAPGLANEAQIKTVKEAVNKPINVLFAFMPQMPLGKYQALKVNRISLGSALANRSIAATLDAANSMLNDGDFAWGADIVGGKVLNKLLG